PRPVLLSVDGGNEEPKRRQEETMGLSKTLLLAVLGVVAVNSAVSAATLDDVKKRGVLRCGIAPNNPGFAFTDASGKQVGFDVDFCPALGAAIFGDATKIETQVAEPATAFTVLTTGAVDVLTHRFTWTFNRDNGAGLEFALTLFQDGQGFMVRKSM